MGDTQKVTCVNMVKVFSDCDDFVLREIQAGGSGKLTVGAAYIDGVVNSGDMSAYILRPLMEDERLVKIKSGVELAEYLIHGSVYCGGCKLVTDMTEAVSHIVNGYCVLIISDPGIAVVFEVKSSEKRSVTDPPTEKAIKGSKDAFVEAFRTNTSLVRRKIKNSALKIREFDVGKRTGNKIALIYIEGLTSGELVAEADRRIKSINVDGILSTGNFEEYVSDCPLSPFPQLITTERVDKFCMNILEGRVGFIIDGMPMTYLAPGTFGHFMKVPEDKSMHFIAASLLTMLRYLSIVITLLLPAFYVAIAVYHQEMVPTKMLMSIIESKRNVPFSTATEVLSMLVAFELLQEAGLRLPNPIGETVSIIGALIVGQSAVDAQVVSPVVVIVVAMAGISGYTMPNQDMSAALRISRFLLVLSALAAGMFGLSVGIAMLIYHLNTLESFGTPYMAPFSSGKAIPISQAILRWPLYRDKFRDRDLKPLDGRNQR